MGISRAVMLAMLGTILYYLELHTVLSSSATPINYRLQRKGVAGAARPSSLLAVATFGAKFLSSLFKTIRKHTFRHLLFSICAALTCRFKQGKTDFLVFATP
jgi:hypothetical protein